MKNDRSAVVLHSGCVGNGQAEIPGWNFLFSTSMSEQPAYLPKKRISSDMPQSLDIPARITTNTKMKTETITTILFCTMLPFSEY